MEAIIPFYRMKAIIPFYRMKAITHVPCCFAVFTRIIHVKPRHLASTGCPPAQLSDSGVRQKDLGTEVFRLNLSSDFISLMSFI